MKPDRQQGRAETQKHEPASLNECEAVFALPASADPQGAPVEQHDGAPTTAPPTTVRHLQTPAALALADLTAIFEDLTKVVGCCEKILSHLQRVSDSTGDIEVEALWTTALVCYRRCFSAAKHGVGLTERDLHETNLEGDLDQWHKTLETLRNYYIDTRVNPRESFAVGVAQDGDGQASGIAISASPQPQPDLTTVQQTGQLALELSRLVDQRIKAQQETVYHAAREMDTDALSNLPVVHLADPQGSGSQSGQETQSP